MSGTRRRGRCRRQIYRKRPGREHRGATPRRKKRERRERYPSTNRELSTSGYDGVSCPVLSSWRVTAHLLPADQADEW